MLAAADEINTVPVQQMALERHWGSSSQNHGSWWYTWTWGDLAGPWHIRAVAGCALCCRARHTR